MHRPVSCTIPISDHLYYKYLVSIDGWTAAWARVPWIMLSNSVLFKQGSNKIEWFYDALKPNVHYLPIAEDLSDLLSQMEYAKLHDEEMKKISDNATDFVRSFLSPDAIERDGVSILNEYAKVYSSN